MRTFKLHLALLAVVLTAVLGVNHLLPALLLLALVACLLNRPQARLCAVTLSVPEVLSKLLPAFRLRCPELFGPVGFTRDFESTTARLGDKLTARISHVPVVGAYNPAPGVGWYNAAQDSGTLIEDIPIYLSQFPIVAVKVGWLSSIAARENVPLAEAAVSNMAFALGKHVVDSILSQAAVSCSNAIHVTPAIGGLDFWDEAIRGQANAQKLKNGGRWSLISTALANSLSADDRVKSALFYGQLNGSKGYRIWTDLAGFAWVKEYPDIINMGSGIQGIFGDDRFACVCARAPKDMMEMDFAEKLGVKPTMKYFPLKDEESGLHLTGASWQEGGTADSYIGCALLFGTSVGNGAGVPGSMTDNAGCLIYTS